MLNQQRNGPGTYYYMEGGFYEGNWKDNRMNGHGKLYYESGKLAYEGMWYLDQFHGRGKLYNEDPVPLSEPFDYRTFNND